MPPQQRDPNGQIPHTSWIQMVWVVIIAMIFGVLVGRCQIPLFAHCSVPGANDTFTKMPDTNTSLGWNLISPAHADGDVFDMGWESWRAAKTSTTTESSQDETEPTPDWMHLVSAKMNSSAKPCEDFYNYACGTHINNIGTSDAKVSVNAFTDLNDLVQKQLLSVLKEKIDENETTASKLPKHLYQLCMDKPRTEVEGVVSMLQYYWKLGGWPVLAGDGWNKDGYWSLETMMHNLREAGFSTSYLFDISVRSDLVKPSRRAIYIDQPTLSINREYLTEGHPKLQTYLDYSVEMAVLMGAEKERAKRELNDSVIFEIGLAKISMPNNERQNTLMSLQEFDDKYHYVDWVYVFSKMFIDTNIVVDENDFIIVRNPQFMENLGKLLYESDSRAVANYAMRRVTNFAASFISEDLQKVQVNYSAELCDDQKREYPCLDIATESLPMSVERKYNRDHLRKYLPYVVGLSSFFFTEKAKLYGDSKLTAQEHEDHCLDVVSKSMPIAVGALYIRKYFNDTSRRAALDMVNEIKNAFMEILRNVDWMDETTRTSALEKLNSMVFHIGYPDELMDDNMLHEYYRDLKFVPENSYLFTVLPINRFSTSKNFMKLYQAVNKTDWTTHSNQAGVDAFYNPTENSIHFPASYFQGQLFSIDRPKYMNYGAMGSVIGREITRGFYEEGRDVDQRGRRVLWWQRHTDVAFGKKLQCLSEHYDDYTWNVEFPGWTWKLKRNGIKTLVENVADNGGIKVAYDAYKNWAKNNTQEPGLPGLDLTPQQMVWLSAAQTWYSVYRPDTIEKRNASIDSRISPGQFRVLGPMSNMKEFSDDFSCPSGSPMHPMARCKIW